MSMTRRMCSPGAEQLLDKYFPVLDHGFISLVDYMGSDESIERAARVSYGKTVVRNRNDTRNLIRYMYRHRHTSPFESVELQFHCSMPIFVARQWIRHRTASVSEISGRYSILPMLFYTPESDQVRPQSATNKQGRAEDAVDEGTFRSAKALWGTCRRQSTMTYEWLNEHGVARELARIDLPLSTYTQWYWKTDLHNLMHFLTLRTDSHAQYEIRVYADIIAGMLKEVAPLSYEAWVDYRLCGVELSRMEMEVVRELIEDAPTPSDELSKREQEEFNAKLRPAAKRDFTLDMTVTKSADYFAEIMEKAK